jgi:DNA-binding CsgD family transcriptional regulator
MIQGMSYGEIANRLFLSINTVKTHSRSLIRKFGVNNRIQVIVKAVEGGFKA